MPSSLISYKVHEVIPYINWIYFFHAWGFSPKFTAIANIHGCDSCRALWLASFPQEERSKAAEAMQLFKEANRMLNRLEEEITIKCIYKLCSVHAEEDDLVIHDVSGGAQQDASHEPQDIQVVRFPLLRQQTPHTDGNPYLCLSDFIRPLSSGKEDVIGLFASSTGAEAEGQYKDDPYKFLLVQTLTDRLTEAATEKMHEHVRRTAWGYAPDEMLSIQELLDGKYQGIRPAVGYPSLPDQSVNFLLDKLLDFKRIGVTLTENGAMHPHASVCGLMMAHPKAHHFAVGKIGEDQLEDYARRRGVPTDELRKFLGTNQ